ncbi:MAG: conjugal transfer protein TraG, partial [Desulfovibrionales bacterium]|nr:conjugal transfer protein TraG [Desulfovibrionales bacterium]
MCAKNREYGLGEKSPKISSRWLYLPFMLLLGLGSMSLATQRIAHFFHYHPSLGQPLGVAFGFPWYAPWSALSWQNQFSTHDPHGFIELAITHSQVLFLMPQFLVIGFWLYFNKKLR